MNNEVKNVPELRFPEFSGEWKEKELGQCTNLITKGTTPKDKSGKGTINYIKVENIYNGKINPRMKININEHEGYLKRSKLEANDILFSIAGTLGRTAVVNKSHLPANTNQALAIIRGYDFETNFLITTLGGHAVAKYIRKNPTVGAQPNLSLNQVSKLIINTPSKNEQKKIGIFFSKLDRQIELEEKKLELLEQQKRGYMQKLFSQEIRFKDNKGNSYPDWKIVSIGDILEERTERSGEGDMLSVTINNGIIKFDEIDRKDNSSKDKSNYRKVYKDDIAYNSMRMWQGASGKSEYEGIVSPAYTVTIPNENINPDFIAYYFKTHKLIHKFKINSQGLTSDTWNLKYRQLKDIKINLCSKEEQSKIANLLIMYDKLINKQKHKLEILKTNKKGFLQKMFI